MRAYLTAAAAAAAAVVSLSTPAAARDGSSYVGVEGGIIVDGEAEMDLKVTDGSQTVDLDNAVHIDFKRGADLDVIAGYDFGMFRAQAELGYKRLKARHVDLVDGFISEDDFDDAFDTEAHATVWSLMGNALVDLGGNAGVGAYVGAGVGAARGRFRGESGTALAWQLLAGVTMPVSSNVDVGLKYRFFNSQKLKFSDTLDAGDLGVFDIGARGKLRTHSLLARIIFNFAPPPVLVPPSDVAPPVAPPPPPATQTCADGTVILATGVCPPPPPPPPPPAAPQSPGERG
jgi:opacity protein-like surface antigen